MTVHVLTTSDGPSAPILFSILAKAIPARRQGRPVSVSTLHRWRTRGLKGITLEAIQIGGSWYSSLDAFQRFCEALSANNSPSVTRQPSCRASDGAVDTALEGLGY